ncbi:DUF2490 domain-containing protein [Winogradskyella poriferorum]|uniref:DUF2490 domain-containing protein n=1 Tax=Winogradskyella poriferorum TaxID=307627 RepID=UPI003D647F1F
MRTLFFIFSTLIISLNLNSQNISEDYLGSWYSYSSSHRINERFSVNPYAELRLYEASSNYNLAYVSIGGTYHMKNKQSLGFGYAYVDIDTVFEFDDEPNVHEHRLFQQYSKSHKLGAFNVSHRSRLEQRFLEFNSGWELQNRFRYRIQFNYQINKTFSLVLSEEPFINFQDQVFHENRFYAGIGLNVMKNSRIQLGYMKQHIRKNNLNRLIIGVSITTDTRKISQPIAHL